MTDVHNAPPDQTLRVLCFHLPPIRDFDFIAFAGKLETLLVLVQPKHSMFHEQEPESFFTMLLTSGRAAVSHVSALMCRVATVVM